MVTPCSFPAVSRFAGKRKICHDRCWLVEADACVLGSAFLSVILQPTLKHSCTLKKQHKGHVPGCWGPLLFQAVASTPWAL